MNRRSIGLLVGVGCVVLAGTACSTNPRDSWDPNSEIRHPLSPTQLRIHPLTRLVRREGEGDYSLDLHFELIDRWEHSTKALGRFTVSLFRQEQARDGRGVPIRRWEIDLRDPDENARPYDRVTRTYRFLLTGIPSDAVRAESLRIDAQFELLDGSRLRDESPIARQAGDGG